MHVAYGRVRRKSRIGAEDAGERAMNRTTTNGEVNRF